MWLTRRVSAYVTIFVTSGVGSFLSMPHRKVASGESRHHIATGLFQAHLEKGISSHPHIWTNRAAHRSVKAPGSQGSGSQGLRSVGQLVYKASLVHWGQALRAKVHKKHSLCFLGRIKHLSGYWVSLVYVTASQSDPSSGTSCQRLTQQHSASGPRARSPKSYLPQSLGQFYPAT